MKKALFGGQDEDYGPCACGKFRATVPIAIPESWDDASEEMQMLESNNFPFAMGYDYRRIFGPVSDGGGYLLNFSSCHDCCKRAVEMGLAEEVEDVGVSSNCLIESILNKVGEKLFG